MNKWQKTGVTSAGVVLIAVLASFLYPTDYLSILSSEPSKDVFLLDYTQRERAEYLVRGVSGCPYYLIRADISDLKVLCGSKEVLASDTKVGYKTTKWFNLTRNLSSAKVEATESGKILRSTSMLRGKTHNGVLTELIEVSKEKVKISHVYSPVGLEPHRVGWHIKKDFGASLQVSDLLYVGQAGNVYWYGEKSGILATDPAVILADSNLTYYVWNGSSYLNVTNRTMFNYASFPCRLRDVECQPVFQNLSRGNLTLNITGQNISDGRMGNATNITRFTGQNVTLTYNSTNVSARNYTVTYAFPMFVLNNTGVLNISYVQTRLNDSCSYVNLTIANASDGRKINWSTGYVNISAPLNASVPYNSSNVTSVRHLFFFLNFSYVIPSNFTNETRLSCPEIEPIFEVR